MDSIKKQYYKLSTKEFNNLINGIINSPDTLVIFKDLDKKYYFNMDDNISSLLIKLHDVQKEFDLMIDDFSFFGQKQIIQSFLIDEIQSTNLIENIISTKHDIFYLINEGFNNNDKKIKSITNSYSILLNNNFNNIDSLQSIRDLYDVLMKDILDKEDYLDGQYFRKDLVYINDGIKNIYKGFYPEDKVNKGMLEFVKLYNDLNLDNYIRLALSHFVFETVHPFYDGNGRLGRLLLSMNMYSNTNSYLSFVLSKAIADNKSKYYKILLDARDDREYGILNYFVYEFCSIIYKHYQEVLDNLKFKKDIISDYQIDNDYSKLEKKVLHLLKEASVLSDYGVNKKEIMNNSGISKRTLMYTLKKLKDDNKLDVTRIGRNNYYMYKE